MDGKLAFLFPGQGSQYVGMGRTLYQESAPARGVFEEADSTLGFSLSGLIFDGPEDALNLTENTQPAILAVSVAMFRHVRSLGINPDMVTGHSLGAYSALVAAGALPFHDALRVVRERGRLMQNVVKPGEGAMAAIIGLDKDSTLRACREAQGYGVVVPANFNCPGQIVISGQKGAVTAAAEAAKAAGARRVVFLPVSGPFHSPLMAPVEKDLEQILSAIPIEPPAVEFVSDTEARSLRDPGEIRAYLQNQVASPVRFDEVLELMAGMGASHFAEIGPGQVLGGFVKRTLKSAHVLSLDPARGGDAALEFLKEVLYYETTRQSSSSHGSV